VVGFRGSAQLGGDGECVEVEPSRHVVWAFKTLAENIVESLVKGDRVSWTGR
jgi:hypothetical protein